MLIRLRSLTALLVTLLLLGTLTPLPVARADTGEMSESQAVSLLQAYSIVRGDPSGALHLDRPLTRAEAATVFIRSFDSEDLAQALASVVPFPDTRGHWGAGEVAVAERLGLMKGDPSGNFRPDSEITYAEVLTVLLRMVKLEPEGAWDPARIMVEATRVGIVPSGVGSSQRALRGKIFWSLATTIAEVPLATGRTVLQQYIDSSPPALSLDSTSANTTEQTVVITGTASGASRVLVNGNASSLNTTTGKFAYTANLAMGANQLQVEAFDLAGNRATATFAATRRANVARIDITGPEAVRVGSSTKLTVKTYDSQNNEVPATGLQAEISGNVATFDVGTLTLKAGNTVGRGTLTLRSGNVSRNYTFDVTNLSSRATALEIASINGGVSPSTGKTATVKVHILDADGKHVTDDYFRTVTLTASGLSGVTVAPQSVTTQAGVATFSVTGTTEGIAGLTATSSNLETSTGSIQFLSTTRVVLIANPTALRPDGTHSSTIRAVLQDDTGRTVNNTSNSDITISLTTSGSDGSLPDELLTIRRGTSTSSGNDAVFRSGVRAGTATITGTITSGHTYSIQSLSLPVNTRLPGVTLQVLGPSTRQTPGGNAATITIRVLDSANRVVTAGSYAFQLDVSTSNGEAKVGGLPEGVELNFPSSAYKPVDDGRPASDPLNDPNAIVGRTQSGTAILNLRYDKSGTVTITPKLIAAVDEAFHPTGGFIPASASAGMSAQPFSLTYAGTPASIKLTVDSNLGKDQPGGAVSAPSNMVVRAQVVDANGAAVPGYTSDVTLTRSTAGGLVTSIVGTNKRASVNGKAEFTVQGSATAGYDTYTATSGTLTSNSVTLAVRNARAETPNVAAVRGVKTGDPSPVTGYVAPDADFMDIQLFAQDPPNTGEPTYWVSAKVYRKGESSPFFLSEAINLMGDQAVIRIPKASLRTGQATYEVVINNGAGDTPRSPDYGYSTAVNSIYNTNFRINSALYDAETGRLVISTSSLASNGTLDTAKLSLVKGDNELNLGDPAVTVHSISSSTVELRLGALAELVNPDTFNGAVTIQAQDAWFATADGSQVARESTTALVKPMAVITQATLEEGARRLYLHGFGFTHGTLSLNLIKFHGSSGDPVALNPGTSTTTDRVNSTTDGQVTITLSQATLDAINSLPGPNVHLTADTGWLRNGTAYRVGAVTGTDHLLFVRTTINSVQYDREAKTLVIRGSGYTGATVYSGKLIFRASGTNATWSPTSSSNATAADDTTIRVELSNADATAFESRYNGRSVFLNTEDGWLVDGHQRTAGAIPLNSVIFSVPAP